VTTAHPHTRPPGYIAITTALLGLLAILTLATAANAAAPPLLRQFCPTGSVAGQCSIPRGMAVNPDTGDVYVADSGNRRIAEFDAWGTFTRAWGWDVVQAGPDDTGTGFEICLPADGDTCQSGTQGSGVGQFASPQGIALDAAGNVYAVDSGALSANNRVQKFDPEGHFLLMFGGDVNKTKVEAAAPETQRNLCPVDPGDVCQFGTPGDGNGQFDFRSNEFAGSTIASSPNGETIYVGDSETIQKFDTAGHFIGDLPDPEGLLVGEAVKALAVDPGGSLYISFGTFDSVIGYAKDGVLKLDPTSGEVECTLKVPRASAIATDAGGRVYVVSARHTTAGESIELVQFDGADCSESERFDLESEGFSESSGLAVSSPPTCGLEGVDLFIANANLSDSFIDLYGPAPDPDLCPPPSVPPTLSDTYTVTVGTASATVGAQINPHFWPDTRYYVEYGTGKCSEGGCTQQQPLAPGAILTQAVLDRDLTTSGVTLSGLAPNTTYHYRFLASSSGGGPTVGPEATLHTYPPAPQPKTDCPNQAFRSGASALLPDCRAYELVSPLDKNNGDVTPVGGGVFQLASPDGDRATYSSSSAFAGPESRPLISQYLSQRDPGQGWLTDSISPPRSSVALFNPTRIEAAVANQFKAFSPDLCRAWLLQDSDLALVPGAPPGVANLYRRDDGFCGQAGYGLITTVAPPGFSSAAEPANSTYVPTIEGLSADGGSVLFSADAVLTADACTTTPGTEADKGIFQLYLHDDAGLHLVSVLPSGQAACRHSAAGTGWPVPGFSTRASVLNALSADATRVFFSTAKAGPEEPFPASSAASKEGPLYVRLNPAKAQSKIEAGSCSQPTRACTYQISSAPTTRFWGADPVGTTAIYTAAGALREYDVAAKASTTIAAEGVVGVMGISEDASRAYFVSTAALSGDQQNSEGQVAAAGKPNLYLHERGGGLTFIATLTSADALVPAEDSAPPSPIAKVPDRRSSRISPDGLHAAFISMAPLTGSDNTDLASGTPDGELYLYDAEPGSAGVVRCISCNPGAARPRGRLIVGGNPGIEDDVRQAATLPGWPSQFGPSRLLSANGNRLFFESFDALLPRDTNGRRDVYQWQRAADQDRCEEIGAELYVAAAGGCLSLISSGQSAEDSYFLGASDSGDDVFLTTAASLLPQDPASIDVYDARVGGGFPPPQVPAAGCEGEACQSPPAPPDDPTPASSTFHGAGNVKEAPTKSCPKHKVKKKGKCVKKHAKHKRHHHRGNHKRRAAR
jgi:DNA-binding beta-propeller fold protein YncE